VLATLVDEAVTLTVQSTVILFGNAWHTSHAPRLWFPHAHAPSVTVAVARRRCDPSRSSSAVSASWLVAPSLSMSILGHRRAIEQATELIRHLDSDFAHGQANQVSPKPPSALRCSAASISSCEYGIGCQEQTPNDIACDR
jgi:hypothetical protein